MKFKINKKLIISVVITTFLLSALLYNILYMKDQKNEIINEIENGEIINVEKDEAEKIEEVKTIFVDVGGEVINPGLYELPENSRINDAINLAGGVTEKADTSLVNLAYVLSDAMKIVVPKKEVKKVISKTTYSNSAPVINVTSGVVENGNSKGSNKININFSNKEQLTSISGIGDSTAQKIIDYRDKNGNFSSIEDIKNVSGIGEKKFEKIKDKITV